MSEPEFPVTIKRGHAVVKIYRTPSRGCEAFTVSYYLGGKRQRVTFADLGLAMNEAETVANRLSPGEDNSQTFTNQDRLACLRAIEVLKPTGVPLETAATQFAQAHSLLGGGSLLEAAGIYLKQNPNRLPRKPVPEIVAELVAAKEADKVSAVYVKDLKSRLGRFAANFQGPISLVTSGEIEDFLRSLKGKDDTGQETIFLSGKSRNNYRRAIGTLLNFAVSRGYLPNGSVQVGDVALAREEKGAIQIFRPEELTNLLEAADRALVPFLTIGAFAGLRHAELQRLDWSEVRLDDGFIQVKASRRLVPIQDNLKRWLMPLRKAGGAICDFANMSKQLLWLSEAVDKKLKATDATAGFIWKRNALRHSFISYRLAQTQNAAQVALEAGNAPRAVLSKYRELAHPAAAEKWFVIGPESSKIPPEKPAEKQSLAEGVKFRLNDWAAGWSE